MADQNGLLSRESALRHHGLAVVAVWIAGVGYMWLLLDRGWVPHDEGTLAQSALRVLQGEVPHRDFEEIYTGGLTYLNALAFEIWGVHLMAMRYVALSAFALWIPVVYWLAMPWGRGVAAAVTLASVSWSYPNYPAAMPSWYMLYLTTGAVACLAHYLRVRRRRWLVAAGLLAGLTCLFKIVGLYVVAGLLLFLVFLEQGDSAVRQKSGPVRGARWFGLLTTTGLLGFAACVYLLVRARLGWPEFVQFVLPSWLCVGFLIVEEWRVSRTPSRQRLSPAVGMLVPFGAGLAVPLLLAITFFAWQGGLDDLVTGVFVTPFRRLSTAAWRPPPVVAVLATGMVAGALLLARLPGWSDRMSALIVGALGALLVVMGGQPGLGQIGYLSISQSVPVLLACAIPLLRNVGKLPDEAGRQRLALLGFMCATYTLLQYPFSTPTYFTFIAPLVILLIASLLTCFQYRRAGMITLMGSYACYAVLWVTPWQFRVHNSSGLLRDAEVRTLLPGLADLKVSQEDWREYESLIPLVRRNAGVDHIFSGPDSPEVYFLSGRRNATRSMFDFFDDQEGRTERILHLLDLHGVRLVVINNHPLFSERLAPALARELQSRYPHDSAVGRFTVRWK